MTYEITITPTNAYYRNLGSGFYDVTFEIDDIFEDHTNGYIFNFELNLDGILNKCYILYTKLHLPTSYTCNYINKKDEKVYINSLEFDVATDDAVLYVPTGTILGYNNVYVGGHYFYFKNVVWIGENVDGYLRFGTYTKSGKTITLNGAISAGSTTTISGYYISNTEYVDFKSDETVRIPNISVPTGVIMEIVTASCVLTGSPSINGTLKCRSVIIE